MAEIYIQKADGALWAVDADSQEFFAGMKLGVPYKCKITLPRNYKFLRKFFALVNFAYDHWDIDEIETEAGPVAKQKEFFRKQLIIKAGYFDQVFRLDGSFTLEAKSISFASMSEEEFGKLYQATSQAILSEVLTNYTQDDLDRVVDEVLRFG